MILQTQLEIENIVKDILSAYYKTHPNINFASTWDAISPATHWAYTQKLIEFTMGCKICDQYNIDDTFFFD